MSTYLGADADAVDAAADQLTAAADELDGSAVGLASTLGSLSWIGNVAIRFSDAWSSVHNPRMAKTSGFLRDAAGQLHLQATEQRNASRSDGSTSQWAHVARRTPDQRLLSDALAAELQRVRGLSAAEQLAWWNSLTDEQRAALLAIRPGELTALGGLPSDVQLAAQAAYTSKIADELQTSSVGIHGEVEVKILWVRAGGGFDVEMRTFKNGRVELDLSGYLKAGVGAGFKGGADAEALAKAGIVGTFEFESQAEAAKFMHDLEMAVVKGDVVGFLKTSASHLGSVRVEAGAEAGVSAGGAGVSAEAGVTVSRDTRLDHIGHVTLSAHQSISGELKGGFLGVTGKVEVTAAARFDGTSPQEITFTMKYDHAALGGAFTPVAEAGSGVTSSGTAEIKFDLTKPEMRHAADLVTAALKRGDVAGASQALSSVMDRAQIVVRQEVGSHDEVSANIYVAKAKLSTDASVTTSTFVKPPGGSFYEVK